MDMNQYLDVFIDEAKEHLQAVNDHLLVFENDLTNINTVNEIFRSAHTLKGMAATMGFEDLASLTHEMENVLDLIRNQKLKASSEIIDVLFKSVDALEKMVFSIIEKGDGKADVTQIVAQLSSIVSGDFKATSTQEKTREQSQGVSTNTNVLNDSMNDIIIDDFELTVLKQSLESGYQVYLIKVTLSSSTVLKAARAYMVFNLLEQNGEIIRSTPSSEDIEEEKFDFSFELIYVSQESAGFLEKVVMKISEIKKVIVTPINLANLKTTKYSIDSVAEHEGKEMRRESKEKENDQIASTTSLEQKENETKNTTAQTKAQNKTIRVNIERLDVLMNLFSELVIDRGRLEQISGEVDHHELHETVEHMSRISGDLQNLILTMRMVPIEQVFNRFPRMVRGLAKELDKKVDLQIIGAETELDRTVIDEIGDPLVHLLRNALDHGLESTEERKRQGKPETGTVQLKAFHSGNHVFIEIIDDGKGIDCEKVLKKSIEKNVITKERANELSDQEVYQLLFASGISTAEKITDVSGRGVGLDVVKNKIESLGGVVSVDSEIAKGSTFSIQLPLTLSIISAMLVQISDAKYAIPLTSIIETAVYKKENIRSVHQQKVIDFRGKVVPLVSLKDLFEVPDRDEEEDGDVISLVIVRKGEKMAGLIVDSFIGQQEIVLKSLGKYLVNVFAISGATILGDGQVALIMDCNALIK